MSHFLESKKIRTALVIIGSLIVVLVVFGLGINIGYNRANFGSRFGQNYYRNFYNGSATNAPPMGPAPMSEHGTAGTVIDISTSTISVADQNENEHSIVVSPQTVIRENNTTIGINGIEINDQVVVIGDPNAQGQVSARFVRVFPASSSMPIPQAQ